MRKATIHMAVDPIQQKLCWIICGVYLYCERYCYSCNAVDPTKETCAKSCGSHPATRQHDELLLCNSCCCRSYNQCKPGISLPSCGRSTCKIERDMGIGDDLPDVCAGPQPRSSTAKLYPRFILRCFTSDVGATTALAC